MGWTLLVITIIIAFTIVRIGAVAFQLTGLPWSLAKFQALSCFSGTGFTTNESELVTTNVQRRRIASFLMVLGNAGIVTLIASGANVLSPQHTLWSQLSERVLPISIPVYLVPWMNLGMIIISVMVVYRIFTNPKISNRITSIVRQRLKKREAFQPASFEELLIATGGYGIVRVHPIAANPILNKTLRDSQLRQLDITLLAIVHENRTIPNPKADTLIHEGDELICFGKLDNIRKQLGHT